MYLEGGKLRIHDQREWDNWLEYTYNLIERGMNKGEAERFRGKRGDRLENRLQRPDELISRTTPADVNPTSTLKSKWAARGGEISPPVQ
jgi:hypothetical protein